MILSFHEKTLENALSQLNRLITTYYRDMDDLKYLAPEELFGYLARDIRYLKDPPGKELMMRPKYLRLRGAGDCDDKTIASCSYFLCKGIRCGYAIVSERSNRPFHHVFAFYFEGNAIKDFDCTYAENTFGAVKDYPKRKNFFIEATNGRL